jgi:hypothetical protein
MNLSEKWQQVAQLKAWLDSFRPLSPTLVAELKKLYDVRFTKKNGRSVAEGSSPVISLTAFSSPSDF